MGWELSTLAPRLHRVPKPVLRAVFGKALGGKIWEQTRRGSEPNAPAKCSDAIPVLEGEIVVGMIQYVSKQASETLRGRGRHARAIGVRVIYADGVSRTERTVLVRATNDAKEIGTAAMTLLGRSKEYPACPEEIELKVSSVPAECASKHVRGRANRLTQAMTSPMPARI
jgi:hypothetical protein